MCLNSTMWKKGRLTALPKYVYRTMTEKEARNILRTGLVKPHVATQVFFTLTLADAKNYIVRWHVPLIMDDNTVLRFDTYGLKASNFRRDKTDKDEPGKSSACYYKAPYIVFDPRNVKCVYKRPPL